MSNWKYDSGGHKKDQKKYAENYARIFAKPCPQCGTKNGHKMDCTHDDISRNSKNTQRND